MIELWSLDVFLEVGLDGSTNVVCKVKNTSRLVQAKSKQNVKKDSWLGSRGSFPIRADVARRE